MLPEGCKCRYCGKLLLQVTHIEQSGGEGKDELLGVVSVSGTHQIMTLGRSKRASGVFVRFQMSQDGAIYWQGRYRSWLFHSTNQISEMKTFDPRSRLRKFTSYILNL